MLRINVNGSDQTGEIKLSGRVIGPWVEELRTQCQRVLDEKARLTLDLEQVSFVDSDGAQLLLNLRSQRVELANCSRFVAEQLRTATTYQYRGAVK